MKPTEIIKEYPLYPKGTVQFGYGKQTGMRVGFDPLMAKIDIPIECGLTPNEWFVIAKHRGSTVSIFYKMEENGFDTKDGRVYTLPVWLLLDCYQGAWEKLYWEKQNER